MNSRTRSGAQRLVGVAIALTITCALNTTVLSNAAFAANASSTRYLGSAPANALNKPIVGMAATPSGKGYWLVASDGGIFTFGDARFHGSTGNHHLNKPIVDMASTPSGHGYWLVASDGGIFTFGDARFGGSTGNHHLNQPIVGIAATHSGHGYWLVASDGGIFTFGDARFHGSTGSHRLNQKIVDLAATPSGRGYWLVAADGGIFTFGRAHFYGSATNRSRSAPIVAMAATPSGKGYWIANSDGSTVAFGDARAFGTQLAASAGAVVTIAASPRTGFWVAARNGTVGTSTTSAPTSTSKPTRAQKIALELLHRMNVERAARHLSALRWDPLLAGYANSWAHTIMSSNYARHQNLGAILDAAGGRFEQAGENIFAGQGSAADAGTAHLALMGSATHRENMLLPQGRLVGIGTVCTGGKLVVVEDFAITTGSPLPPAGQGIPSANPVVSKSAGGAHC